MLNNKSIGKGQLPIVTKVVLSGISGDLVAGTCQSNKYLDQYLERDKEFGKKKMLDQSFEAQSVFSPAFNLT